MVKVGQNVQQLIGLLFPHPCAYIHVVTINALHQHIHIHGKQIITRLHDESEYLLCGGMLFTFNNKEFNSYSLLLLI